MINVAKMITNLEKAYFFKKYVNATAKKKPITDEIIARE